MASFETKSSTLTDQFLELMAGQADVAIANFEAVLLIRQREWYLPPGAQWAGSVLDFDHTSEGFPRDEPTDLYQQCLTEDPPGSAGEAAARKLEHDRIAAAERAFRLRHCTSIRAAAHAAARLRGHSHERGLLRFAVPAYLQNLIDRGDGENKE